MWSCIIFSIETCGEWMKHFTYKTFELVILDLYTFTEKNVSSLSLLARTEKLVGPTLGPLNYIHIIGLTLFNYSEHLTDLCRPKLILYLVLGSNHYKVTSEQWIKHGNQTWNIKPVNCGLAIVKKHNKRATSKPETHFGASCAVSGHFSNRGATTTVQEEI